MRSGADPDDMIAFDNFRLYPSHRLIERDGVPIALSGRPLQLLITLAERAGEIVTKQDLIAAVWPDVTVEEGSLRFSMVALRKALGEGMNGRRFISTVPNRGYCFVATLTRGGAPSPAPQTDPLRFIKTLPSAIESMVGRDTAVAEVAELLADYRFVNITGPGGMGKTTVAVAVGHAMEHAYADGVYFVELAPLHDPALVPTAVAGALGLEARSNDVTGIMAGYLRGRRILLILDNCEHLIEAVASLVDQVRAHSPDVAILTTSREALRIEGERTYRLAALASPPEDLPPTAAAIMEFPATRLFIERARARDRTFILNEVDAPVIADICRKLDGMALAIELAASRVEMFGLAALSEMLGGRIRLLWRGRRTAPARHHTLSATLDWSYTLLSGAERRVLDRFSVFVGVSTLEAMVAVIADDMLDRTDVVETIAGLVEKSLISAQVGTSGRRYQLLQTTRAYLREKVALSDDDQATARRHADHFRNFLTSSQQGVPPVRGWAVYGEHLGNIRAALEWSLSSSGDRPLGVALAAAAANIFQDLSLLDECEAWCARALAALDARTRGSRDEMELQAAYGLSMMFTSGNREEVREALTRGVDLAETWGDGLRELQILGRLNTFETRVCKFEAAVATARRGEIVARTLGDPAAVAMAGWMLGVSLHGAGDQGAAQRYCEDAVGEAPGPARVDAHPLSADYKLRGLNALGRCLWLTGRSKRALQIVGKGTAIARELNDPLASNINAMYVAPVFMWMEQWDAAEAQIEWQIPHAEKHGWGPYRAVGLGLRGDLAVRRGRPDLGIPILRDSLEQLRAERQTIWLGTFLSALAQGFLLSGDIEAANAAVEEAIEQCERDGETWFTPEVFRTAALVAARQDDPGARVEPLLERALAIARRQSALAWELRATIDLAARWGRAGRHEEAISLLRPLYHRYAYEDATPDLRRAARLLNEMGWTTPCGGGVGLPSILFSHEA